MKKLLKNKKIYKVIFISILFIYIICIFVSQQKTLNSYKEQKADVSTQIQEQTEQKNTLVSMKENINSPEYITKFAREKLDMYFPNERVYIDIGK